jgi:two-component system chemotaxis sensor kinase CheA
MDGHFEVAEFLAGYLAEVDDHLTSANRNLLAVDDSERRGDSNAGAVRELYRSLHTIKGLSGMVGVEAIVDLSHAMEAVLRAADRGGGGRLAATAIETLGEGLRAIAQRLRCVADRRAVPAAPQRLLAALAALEPSAVERGERLVLPAEIASRLSASEREQLASGARAGRRCVAVDFIPSAARAARGVGITSVRERIARLGEIVKVIPQSRPSDGDAPGGLAFTLILVTGAGDVELAAAVDAADADAAVRTLVAAAPPGAGATAGAAGEPLDAPEAELGAQRGVVRVEVARLDDALEKLSALVVSRFRLGRVVGDLRRQGADVRRLADIVQEHGRQLRDLRSAIMRARMIPVAELLERLPLLVRGLGSARGKEVELQIDAGRAELDKAVAERVFPALVHLIRNAVDHGLESPEERARAGKPAAGVVRITCFESANNQLELVVSDDGRGVDREAVARRAGRDVPATDEGLLALLTIPGMSTMERATTTSGRGIGMDIVKRIAVEELGGELTLGTESGRGTTFKLRIPLTITIQDAFAFRCGSQPFVVPVSMVEEVIEVDPARLLSSPAFGGARAAAVSVIERRGTPLPLVSLDVLFALPPDRGGLRKAIVVRRGGEPVAFEVDQMLGQQEVVVRPIDDPLVKVPGVAGSTDLGDGRPTLVLDLVALSGALGGRRSELAQ